MDIKKYGEEVIARIDAMSDEEFNKLLIESGLEECPFEQPYQSTNYHLSWLEIALNHFKQQMKEVHSINGDMTMDEFIKKWAGEELSKVIKVD